MYKMRMRTVLSLLAAPFLAKAALHEPSAAASSSVTQPAYTENLEVTQNGNIGSLAFYLPSADADEYFHFTIDAIRKPDYSSCGDLQLRVNGEYLDRSWITDDYGHASSFPLRRLVSSEGHVSQLNHSFGLQTSSFCYSQGRPQEPTAIEIITFQLLSVDGQSPALSHNAFVATYRSSRDNLQSALSFPNVSSSSSPSLDSATQDLNTSIEDEIVRLNQLEEEYAGVQRLYQGQKQLVNDLGKAQMRLAQDELSQCKTVGCVVKTLYRKTKGCLHLMYLRYGSDSDSEDSLYVFNNSPDTLSQEALSNSTSNTNVTVVTLDKSDCVHATSPLERAHILMSGQRLCSSTASEGSLSSPLSNTFTHRHSTHRALHTTLDIIASVLCLSCLFALLHHRCLNPRTAAERAARREERRARKAYQRAARKQAFKTWWTRHFGSKDVGRIQDYEEKRALILSQEVVLEQRMQAEIDRLRDEANDGLSAAEEGRSEASSIRRGRRVRTASLPPTYRSRASSGRPPSYVSYDEAGGAPRIVDGFRGYRPRRASNVLGRTDRKSREDDRTPATSIYTLSPRQSSETLRTQFSSV